MSGYICGMRGCVWVFMGVCRCVWDEFSEHPLETRVLTSVDFKMYLIQIIMFGF